MKKETTIELFAGAGGLALGVEKAGFETIGLIEFNKDAADTLKRNRPNWNVICDDIANISGENLEERFGIKKGESARPSASPDTTKHARSPLMEILRRVKPRDPDPPR